MSQTAYLHVFTVHGMTEITTDRALVTSALDGDTDAFAALVERYTRSVHALAYSRLLDHGDAEDATQETFLRAYASLARLRHPDIFEAWLHRIVLSCAYDRLRNRAREAVTDVGELLSNAPTESTDMEVLERHQDVMPLVESAVRGLPKSLRDPLLMRYLADAQYSAIGRRLHISESAARKRVERAISRVRDTIARSGGEVSVRHLALFVAPACPLPGRMAEDVARALRSTPPPTSGAGDTASRPTLAVAGVSPSILTGALTLGLFVAELASAPYAATVTEVGTPVEFYVDPAGARPPVTRPGVVRLTRQHYNDLPVGAPLPGWTTGVEAAADPSGERATGVAKVTTNIPNAYYEIPLTRGVVAVEAWMKAGPSPDVGMSLVIASDLGGVHNGNLALSHALATRNTDGPWLYWDGRGMERRRVDFHEEDGAWHYVKAVYTTATNEYDLYFDGELVGSRIRSWVDFSAGISSVGVKSGRWRYNVDEPSYFDDLRVTATNVDDTPLLVENPWEHGPSVLSPTPGTFDGRGVTDPCVLYEDGAYKMWYVGNREWDPERPQYSRMAHIGYATSEDGEHWTKHGMVFAPDKSEWDSHQVMAPSVIRRGSTYEMYSDGNDARKISHGIGRAVSHDGIHWTRDDANPVIHHDDSHDAQYPEFCSAVYADGRYQLWYLATLRSGPRVIRQATSKNGVDWVDVGVALTPTGDGAWDADVIRDAEVVRVGDGWEMWYFGHGGLLSGIGRALSDDGLTWRRELGDPPLTAGPPGHWTYPVTSQPSVVHDGSRWRFWFTGGGAEKQLGHALISNVERRGPVDNTRRDLISQVGP
jgi:RNA polymerase sigma-70 factor (ECF subfamily)